jgi:putative ABC transport system permease protein
VGDELEVTYADGTKHQHQIAAIYEDGGVVAQNNDGHFVVDMSVYEASQPSASQVDNRIMVKAADGVDVESVRKELETLGNDFGSPDVQNLGEVQDAQTKQINQQLGFMVILLAMAIIIGFIGIFNTLLLSVLERTREIGLLRAVGMVRGQVARMVLAESVLVSLLGSILGFVIGLSVGSALMLAIRDDLPTAQLSLPIPVLIIYGLVAVIGGTAAGLLPAFRASRLNVLEAIAVD